MDDDQAQELALNVTGDITPRIALDELDRTWYTKQSPRWMDVIGDYAGQELFVVDGDALVQYVLDNELLALGKTGDASFQLLHATWLLERSIEQMVKRDCTFEIVFFQTNLHGTVHTGEAASVVAARSLARSILMRQAANLPAVKLHIFKSLDDPEWAAYYQRKRPMFLLGFDGGLRTKDDGLEAERILSARAFLFNTMSQEIPVVLLQPADFKDGKMISYVFDRTRKHRSSALPPPILAATNAARVALDAATVSPLSPSSAPSSTSSSGLLAHAAQTFLGVQSDALSSSLLFIYLAHATLLDSIPLASRAQRLPTPSAELSTYLDTTFLPTLYQSLSATIDALPLQSPFPALDLDGRLFFLLLLDTLVSSAPLSDILGPTAFEAVTAQWTTLGQSPVDLTALRTRFSSESTTLPPLPAVEASTLLPFSNPVFDSHLSSVHVSVSDKETYASTPNKLDSDTVFDDKTYWHSPKPLLPTHQGGPAPVQLDARQRKKRDRKEQRYMAAMQKSAASLTGALGTSLKQQVIPAVGKASKAKVVKVSNVVRAPPKNAKVVAKPLTSKEKLIAENAAKKASEEGEQNAKWWTEKLAELKPLAVTAQISLLNGFLKNRRASDRWLGTEITLKRLDLELRKWIADDRREVPLAGDEYRVFLARTTNALLLRAVKSQVAINERQGKALLSILDTLGLSSLVPAGMVFGAAAELAAVEAAKPAAKKGKAGKEKKGEEKKEEKEDKGAKLSFSFVSLAKSGKPLYEYMRVVEDPVEFQLRCMGEHMVRSLDSKPDSRVNFEPDAWQRDVLDKIDRDESMLIVAPTSSGKTFISFAAMEKVLRESDDGIVIYVAPTKALVNQVAAEVFARFSKDVPGANMWAIHTRDYRINNPMNCQILVTVPHILSIMLLNPALASVWSPRIKRIIVDEIHSISEEEGGAIWEQILLMNPAPIIGLSATVGAPERFSAWLESVEENHGRTYSLIQHHHRFNALRKFAYAPQFPTKRIGTLNEHVARPEVFPHVHPIAALALGDPNLPDDLALEPRDALSLWKAMVESGGEVDPRFNPSTYFADTPSVAVKDVIKYEKELKDLLLAWMEAPGSREENSPYQKVVKDLERPLREALEGTEEAIAEGGEDGFHSLFLPLLADLNAQGSLPAIIFNFDRSACEDICKRVLEDLEEAENRWRMKSPEYKRRVAKAKEDEKLARSKAKAQESANRNKKDDDEGRGGDDEGSNSFNPDDPSDEFSFVGKGISQVEFAKEIAELAWLNLPSWLINALRRGVGVHHAGMNRRYRTLVENLFRRGVLRVVISTGTLALGINAPARTCVFGGDSVFLTALNFRQCAGRAGRRGFDNLGLVVFVGVSLDRIQRLLLSRLPKLGGSFPLTTTLILRLHNLLHGSGGAELPTKAIEGLLTLKQLSVGNQTGRDQVVHFVRFSIEYLRRAGLLDETGRPMNLYGIVSTLYPFEPSNFALVALFRSGELHRLTKDFDSSPTSAEETMKELVVVLAHLFGRLQRRKQSPESLRLDLRNSTSAIILPPLPPRVAAALDRHHASIVQIFGTYAREYAQQHTAELGPDDTLPLSGRKVESVPTADGSFVANLRQSEIEVDSRSPFVALSGHGDSYRSVSELAGSSRAGLVLTKHAVPTMPFLTSEDHQLDGYIPEFLKHGSLDVLVRDHGIRRGDVWFDLKNFDDALCSVKAALETLLQRSTDEQDAGDNDSDDGQDQGPVGDDGADKEDEIARPPAVNDADWRLYRAIAMLHREFRAKFFKIFAESFGRPEGRPTLRKTLLTSPFESCSRALPLPSRLPPPNSSLATLAALINTDCPSLKLVARGKVRDIYEVPNHPEALLFVATDRVSAFDVVMKNGIPNKGKLLTQLSLFFFDFLSKAPETKHIPNHVITSKVEEMPEEVQQYKDQLEGRAIWVRRAQVLPVEAIVRGYITGSAWVEYTKSGTMHGIELPKGMKESTQFIPPLFTPSTKAELGDKDENIHPDKLRDILPDPALAEPLKSYALALYSTAARHSLSQGLILADTKFEFGLLPPPASSPDSPPTLMLVDECLTPDSSRFWPAKTWAEGNKMVGFDKQFLREWLKSGGGGFGKKGGGIEEDGVEVPEDIVKATWGKYMEAFKLLTGRTFVV